jgi:site-specific DNA recombinase
MSAKPNPKLTPKLTQKQTSLACAIYTRKSSEEGLEQGFNSLDAQREACEAYVLSQRHEGWRVIASQYDDGGFSGGTMARPALKRLLDDIDKKGIKVVVVYKVDRLTRSLADFAKIVERFDAMGVSFVSVTQQFNTTSSMGRLTLNVLLSFAQFEREVTGERIRDKIAASKQKGMWMGGIPPLGYQGHERTLVINETGAELVRNIYTRYLALGSVWALKRELDASGILTPVRIHGGSNREFGGVRFSRGHLYRILTNPIYIGQIVHHDQVYAGQHPAIIEQALWDAVREKMGENRQGNRQRISAPSVSLLTGLVVDAQGVRLIPSHSQKQAKRFRYYVSEPLTTSSREHAPEGMRIPAQELETLVIDSLCDWLNDSHAILEALNHAEPNRIQAILARARQLAKSVGEEGGERYRLIHSLIGQVIVAPERVKIALHLDELLSEEKDSKEQGKSAYPADTAMRICDAAADPGAAVGSPTGSRYTVDQPDCQSS